MQRFAPPALDLFFFLETFPKRNFGTLSLKDGFLVERRCRPQREFPASCFGTDFRRAFMFATCVVSSWFVFMSNSVP